MTVVPFFRPEIDEDDIAAVVATLRSGWVTTGPKVQEFEIAFANVVNGTASPVLTDDLEVYERVQDALTASRNEWVELGRGHGGDVPDRDGTLRGRTGTSEIHIRNQLAAWLEYLDMGGPEGRADAPAMAPQSAHRSEAPRQSRNAPRPA